MTDGLLHRLEAYARAEPGRIAAGQGGERLTYGALWEASGRIAARLHARGVGPETIVGVHVTRSPAMLAMLTGIWRAGAAWLPLDPAFPDDRLAFMVQDAGCRLLLTDLPVPWLPAGVVALAADDATEPHDGDAPPASEPPSERLAYLIYTSGSTGRPKGVEVTHGALANFLAAMAAQFAVTRADVLLAVTTLSFDIAILELFVPLLAGARVEIAPAEEQLEPERLRARLAACGATLMQATPVTWRMLLHAGWRGPLRAVLCGGETFPAELLAPLAACADAVWNLYGPTEATVWCTAARVDGLPPGRRIPIGAPIAGLRVHVMDESGRPVADGEPGELWIAGAGVARGYRDRPALQARHFVSDPFEPGGRAYRTGDLGRVAEDGQLEHLGRMDAQIKLHGYRIEPGEIEAAIAELEGVAQAVVGLAGPADDARLVAWVRHAPDVAARLTASAMRKALRRVLPDYMVPAMLVELTDVPLTPNGKVDRRALPDPFDSASATPAHPDADAPRTPVERALAAAWCDVLARDRVHRSDNFFELGGHSLLALRVVERLRADDITIDVRQLFFMTLAQVAAAAE